MAAGCARFIVVVVVVVVVCVCVCPFISLNNSTTRFLSTPSLAGNLIDETMIACIVGHAH